jgi:hypothetical protein
MTGFSRSTCLVIFNSHQLLFSFEKTLMPTLAHIWTSTHALSHQLLSSGSNFHDGWRESSLCDMIFLIFNISIARFYICTCIWSSAHYNYSRNWREADRGRLWAYKWRFKQPLLVHTSLTICLLTYVPNPPCQLSWGRKHEYPAETHDFRQSVDFYSFHMRTGFESHWEILIEIWTCGLKGERQVR